MDTFKIFKGPYSLHVSIQMSAARSAVIAVAWSSDYRVEGGGEELQHCKSRDNLVVQVDYPHCIGTNDKASQIELLI
jgi:hypothetical protein